MAIAKSRIATSANLKTKKTLGNNSNHGNHHSSGGSSTSNNNNNIKEDHGNILLARGLSARYCGANIALGPLTSEEVERDLRHMEAFSNACIAYAQQFFIYQNSASLEENGKKVSPMVAMPVRIDPEEEKRLVNLRLKIQQCEAQREILESQYLSLRAHYVYMSQRLKNRRQSVNDRVEFLQDLLQKRGRLVGLQRARLQISREVLACLHYRQSGGKPQGDDDNSAAAAADSSNGADLVEIWTKIDEQFKQAEDACRGEGIELWQALKVPKIPPGVPLLLSPLAKPPGFAAAWTTSGVFGSKKESLCWLESEFPEPPHRTKSLSALREEVDFLKHELQKEQVHNRDLQTEIISRRKANVELIAMMALLRTETEAVVARHNILLESDFAKDAAMDLHMQHDDEELAPSQETEEEEVVAGEEDEDQLAKGSSVETKTTTSTAAAPVPAATVDTAVVLDEKSKKKTADDEENDGDDEGEVEEEEEEDEGDGVLLENGTQKRTLDEAAEASPRTKRRKL